MQGDRSREPREGLPKSCEGATQLPASEPAAEGDEPVDPEFAAPECVELSPEQQAQEFALCRQTLRRIQRMIAIAGAVCAALAIWPFGWQVAMGVLIGILLSWINFRWLAASVNAIGERVVKAQSQERGAAIVARGLGRIGLIALFAYGIFECSVRGFMGFLAGLGMPVIAMTCEAVYEFVVSRGPRQA